MNNIKKNIKGLLLITIIVFVAKVLSIYLYIGPVIISILLGTLINYLYSINNSYSPGIIFSEKYLLSFSIILMGANLDISILNLIEPKTFYILITLIFIAISSSLILGKIFNISSSLSLLVGIGNGICGSSAIAGASSIIKSKKEDIALSIAIINILGLIGIFIIPLFINLFFQDHIIQKGIIIGSTIQTIGHVTAAGFMLSNEIGEIAILIKMIRILMLGPVLISLTLFFSFYNYKISNKKSFQIPYFIIGFIICLISANYSLIPMFLLPIIKVISNYALLFSMAAIGLNFPLKSIFNKGLTVFLVGLISFGLQITAAIYLLL